MEIGHGLRYLKLCTKLSRGSRQAVNEAITYETVERTWMTDLSARWTVGC